MHIVIATTSLAAVMALSACASEPSPEAPPAVVGECRPDDAKALEGKAMLPVEEIKSLTGAKVVRTAGPDDMLTQDFSAQRVTVIVDPATMKVVRATCG